MEPTMKTIGAYAVFTGCGIGLEICKRGMDTLLSEKKITCPFQAYPETSFELCVSETFEETIDTEAGMRLDLYPERGLPPFNYDPAICSEPVRTLYRLTVIPAHITRLQEKGYLQTRCRIDRIEISYTGM